MPKPSKKIDDSLSESKAPRTSSPGVMMGDRDSWIVEAAASENPFAVHLGDSQARFLWHPLVQHQYGHRCIFYRIKMRNRNLRTIQEAVSTLMTEAHVTTYSPFPILGAWDLLLRAWLNPSEHTAVADKFTQSNAIEEFEEFHVEDFRFLWLQDGLPGLDSKTIEIHRKDVLQVCKRPTEDLVLKLFDDGLLIPVRPRDPKRIPFFIGFHALPGSGRGDSRGIDAMSEVAKNLDDASVTIYKGIGFTNYLLRMCSEDYFEIGRRLEGIFTDVAEEWKLHTETFVAAKLPEWEHDELDPREVGGSITTLGSILGGEFYDEIRELDPATQEQIRSVFVSYSSSLLSGHVEPLFRALFIGRIVSKIEPINSCLPIINHFERLFKRHFSRILSNHFGEDSWEEDFRSVLKEIPTLNASEVARPFMMQSVGTLGQGLNVIARADGLDVGILEASLGTRWPKKLELFTRQIRNPFAHGETFSSEYEEEFMNDWKERATLVCEVGVLYLLLLALDDEQE